MKKPTNNIGFVIRGALLALLCVLGLGLAVFSVRQALAQDQSSGTPAVKGIYRGVLPVVKQDVSPPLRSMKVISPTQGKKRENDDVDIIQPRIHFAPEWDPVVQSSLGRGTAAGTEIPGPLASFNAQTNTTGSVPPDPNGAVGPNHVVTMCNLSFEILDKTGNVLFGPAANNTLWAGFGGDCQVDNSGDPVVLYDHLSDRWVLTQFTASGPTYFECIAVSQTNDPLGAYYRYAISTGNNFPDYPKASVWPDAYYFSTREFTNGSVFAGVGAYALNRAQAIAGTAQIISFLAPPTPLYKVGDGLLPSDLDGTTLPPAGSPAYFVGSQDNNYGYGAPSDALNLYKFHADFVNPPNSTFGLTNTIPVQSFNSVLGLCPSGARNCIPQPGTTIKIDHLGYRQRPTFRLAYRNFGDHESLVTNQSVSGGTGPNGEVSGIRWWEIRDPNGTPTIFQEGTYAPGITDGIHRWMGSIAMDKDGNMALGYSASNGTNPSVYPSVFYTGRMANDPPGVMTLGEGSIINGTGSQTTTFYRWGDYTSLTLDPTDDQTFWYVNEWVPTTSSTGWVVRVGSFKLTTGGTSITLQARVKGQVGNRNVQLKWSPADGGRIDIIRNGATVGRTTDDGSASDKLGSQTGTFTYQVCETDSGDCSNEVQVQVQ